MIASRMILPMLMILLMVRSSQFKPLGYEIVNLGGGKNSISLNTIIRWVECFLKKHAIIEEKPFHQANVNQYGQIFLSK